MGWREGWEAAALPIKQILSNLMSIWQFISLKQQNSGKTNAKPPPPPPLTFSLCHAHERIDTIIGDFGWSNSNVKNDAVLYC